VCGASFVSFNEEKKDKNKINNKKRRKGKRKDNFSVGILPTVSKVKVDYQVEDEDRRRRRRRRRLSDVYRRRFGSIEEETEKCLSHFILCLLCLYCRFKRL